MRSFHYLAVVTALAKLALVAQCAPIPLQLGTIYGHNDLNDPSVHPLTAEEQHHAETIHQATEAAHAQVLKMQELLNQPHEVAHPHLVNAFGEGYNKAWIKDTVDRLASGTIHIGKVNQPNVGDSTHNIAETWPATKNAEARISLLNKFHEMNPDARAGTIIHEATHALADTRDWFSAKPNDPTKFMPLHPGDKEKKAQAGEILKVGYHYDIQTGGTRQDFLDLKQHAGKVMHKNADSFKILAHTATHGLDKKLPAPFPPLNAQTGHGQAGSSSSSSHSHAGSSSPSHSSAGQSPANPHQPCPNPKKKDCVIV